MLLCLCLKWVYVFKFYHWASQIIGKAVLISWSRARGYNKLTISVKKNIEHDCIIICHISYNHVRSGTVCFLLRNIFHNVQLENASWQYIHADFDDLFENEKTMCFEIDWPIIMDYPKTVTPGPMIDNPFDQYSMVIDDQSKGTWHCVGKKHPLLCFFFSRNLGVLP